MNSLDKKEQDDMNSQDMKKQDDIMNSLKNEGTG